MDFVYQPKGGMCIACKNARKDCSDLDFKSMKAISERDGVVVVKCTEFVREVY